MQSSIQPTRRVMLPTTETHQEQSLFTVNQGQDVSQNKEKKTEPRATGLKIDSCTMTSAVTLQSSLSSQKSIRSLLWVTVGLVLLATPAFSWSPASYRGGRVVARPAATSSPLFGQDGRLQDRRRSWSSLHSTEESGETDAVPPSSSSSEVSEESSGDDVEEEKFGILKTILLAGPLFIKFTIVLLIKFVTDLIVFPLLWLYRLARLTKRKFLKMIGKGDREYPNGEQKSS